MAAVLSCDMEHTDKVVSFIDECAGLGLDVQPPDVNASSFAFTVAGPGTIRYGLGAIKGVGEGAVEAIVGERERHGAFRDLVDLRRRVDLRLAGKRTLEAMLKAGCFDSCARRAPRSPRCLPAAIQLGEQRTRAHAAGQDDLFWRPCGPRHRRRPRDDPRSRCFPSGAEAQRLAGRARDAAACSCPAIRSPSTSRSCARSRRRASWISAGRGRRPSSASAAART